METNADFTPVSGKMCRNEDPVRPAENPCRLVISESYVADPELPGWGLIAQLGLLPLRLALFDVGGHENNGQQPLQIRPRGSNMKRKASGHVNQQNDQLDAA